MVINDFFNQLSGWGQLPYPGGMRNQPVWYAELMACCRNEHTRWLKGGAEKP